MAFWNKINYDIDVDKHIAAEKSAAEGIRNELRECMKELDEIKHFEKLFKKADNLLLNAALKKENVENKFEIKIRQARSYGKPEKELKLKHKKYWKMARISRKTYKKLRKMLIKLSGFPEAEKRFEQLNQRLENELKNLLSEIREEYVEERKEASS